MKTLEKKSVSQVWFEKWKYFSRKYMQMIFVLNQTQHLHIWTDKNEIVHNSEIFECF